MVTDNGWKKISVIAIMAVFLLGLSLMAVPPEPAQKKGAEVTVVYGTAIDWDDLSEIAYKPITQRKMRPVRNFEDPCTVITKLLEIDPVADRRIRKSNAPVRELALSNPVKSFDGLSLMEHGSGWPPDTNGDAGINHYVQTVNTSFGIFNKSTGALIGAREFNDFFPLECGVPCDNDNNGDPIVLFDQIHQRWFMLGFAWTGTTNGSHFSIAVSQSPDPTGAWWTYCLKADDVLMNDYPKCGVWHDGIYVTANMFAFGGSYQQSKIWAIKTPDLYKGRLIAQSTTTLSLRSFSIMPGCARGKTPPPAGSPNYLYSIDANEFGGLHTDALHVWKYKVDWRTPANTTFSGPEILPVAPYDLTSSRIPQLDTTWTLDSLYGRLMFSTVYRNYGYYSTESGEAVYLSHTAEYMGSRAVRWYELRIRNGVSSVYQQGTYSPDAKHRWMGSVCADKNGSIAIGYSTSSTLMYPAIQYTGRRVTDPPGIMGAEKTLIRGTGSQSRISRWGDYSMMTIDPVDDETFWYTQEYYLATAVSPQLPDWHTRIGSFKISGAAGFVLPPVATGIDVALDITGQKFYQKGTRKFVVTTAAPYFGPSCVTAPAELTHNESCRLETTVSKKTSVKFWWKVSSESGWDYLNFYIDGVLQARISGEAGWAQKVYTLTPGTHTLSWAYIKDSADDGGSDTGWVDRVQIN